MESTGTQAGQPIDPLGSSSSGDLELTLGGVNDSHLQHAMTIYHGKKGEIGKRGVEGEFSVEG